MMVCDRYRDAISAIVDGEDPGLDRRIVEAHLSHCADCATFRSSSEAVRRRLRVAAVEPDAVESHGRDSHGRDSHVDVSRRIARLAAAADRSGSRRGVRLLLVVVAAEIMIISVVDLARAGGGPGEVHGVRHLAAFTIAYAVLLVVVAVRPARARTALPVAAVLAGALAISAVVDLVSGRIPLVDEAMHLPEIVSVLLIWMLATTQHDERSRRAAPTELRVVPTERNVG